MPHYDIIKLNLVIIEVQDHHTFGTTTLAQSYQNNIYIHNSSKIGHGYSLYSLSSSINNGKINKEEDSEIIDT